MELITTPTLLRYPVSPDKKKILLTGLILGLITSCLISIFLERKKNLIFSTKQLKLFSTSNSFQKYRPKIITLLVKI